MRALVIDEDPQIRRALRVGLELNGYTVLLAASGEAGLDAAAEQSPDAILLDLGLPDLDGLEVCRQLREWSSAPIVVLSGRDGQEDKIAAFDLGADDYLTKPFSLTELLARLRAILRRVKRAEGPKASTFFSVGDLEIDFNRRRVTLAGSEVHLTPIEYKLLCTLARHMDHVLTHRQLLRKVWGTNDAAYNHKLCVHIANLRNKLEPDPACPRLLHTEPRIGYRFADTGRPTPDVEETARRREPREWGSELP